MKVSEQSQEYQLKMLKIIPVENFKPGQDTGSYLFPYQSDHYCPFRQGIPISFNGSLVRQTTKTAPNKYDPGFLNRCW